jgi:cold shock CspA family protein
MAVNSEKLTRIGIFYDGNFFSNVSNYYTYHHEKRSRLSIGGLHDFIRQEVARSEGADYRYCQIVDVHYFRGRLSAAEAQERNLLLKERSFDDVLMREGIVTHYLPLFGGSESGIDVWLSVEALELAIMKGFSVVVLIACDGDYVPLVRKLNTLGQRVMVLGWDFDFADDAGVQRQTRTSQALLSEVTYPVLMSTVIDDRSRRDDPVVRSLFLPRREPQALQPQLPERNSQPALDQDQRLRQRRGIVQNLKDGFGFIAPEDGGDNLFFFHTDLLEPDFIDLARGDSVSFMVGMNKQGPCAKAVRRIAANGQNS